MARRAIARPRLGVNPFRTAARPHWLVQMLEERRAAAAVAAFQARGVACVVKRSYVRAADGVCFTRVEVEADRDGGLF